MVTVERLCPLGVKEHSRLEEKKKKKKKAPKTFGTLFFPLSSTQLTTTLV